MLSSLRDLGFVEELVLRWKSTNQLTLGNHFLIKRHMTNPGLKAPCKDTWKRLGLTVRLQGMLPFNFKYGWQGQGQIWNLIRKSTFCTGWRRIEDWPESDKSQRLQMKFSLTWALNTSISHRLFKSRLYNSVAWKFTEHSFKFNAINLSTAEEPAYFDNKMLHMKYAYTALTSKFRNWQHWLRNRKPDPPKG